MENNTTSQEPSVGLKPNLLQGNNALKGWLVNSNISHLMGEVLTVIDASVEGEKNKAMKDLIRTAFGKTQQWIVSLAWAEQEKEGETHGPASDWELGLIPFDPEKHYSFKSIN